MRENPEVHGNTQIIRNQQKNPQNIINVSRNI